MSAQAPTLRELLGQLQAQQVIAPEAVPPIEANLETATKVPREPLGIRILLGTGAWFAALFILLCLGIAGVIRGVGGWATCGVMLLVIAVVSARTVRSLFVSQLALALALAGNVLILGATMDFSPSEDGFNALLAHAVVCSVVYALFPSAVYRFLAPILLATLFVFWTVSKELAMLFHGLVGLEMLLVGYLFLRKRLTETLRPLAYSAATALPGTLLFLNLMQIPHWGEKFRSPLWPSSVLLSAGLIYLYVHLAGTRDRLREPWLMLAVGFTVLLGLFSTPGILVAIGLLLLGFARDDRRLMSLAWTFLPCFLVLLYYALNINLAYKSYIVAGSGVVLLAVWWLVGRLETGKEAA